MIGFVPSDKVLAVADAVMSAQRDYGNRVDRAHARLKYTIDDKGLDWVKQEIESRFGFPLEAPRPYHFASNGDALGWMRGEDGRHHFTLFIENGRIINGPGQALMDDLREIARIHRGTFRLTPNQNLVIADITPGARPKLKALLEEHGLAALNRRLASATQFHGLRRLANLRKLYPTSGKAANRAMLLSHGGYAQTDLVDSHRAVPIKSFAHMGRFGSRDEIHTRIDNTPAAVSVSKV